MVHPELALADPIYWVSLVFAAATIPLLFCANRSWFPANARIPTILVTLAAGPASAIYALIGSACYVSGSCL